MYVKIELSERERSTLIQHVHDDMAQPHAVQTTKRYEKQVVEGVQAHVSSGCSLCFHHTSDISIPDDGGGFRR